MTADVFSLVIVTYLLPSRICANNMSQHSVCQCIGYAMFCEHGDLPSHLPLEVREIFIQHFNLDNVDRIQLQNVSAIQRLDIQADKGKSIPSKSFELFQNLTYLGLHGKELRRIHTDAFLGLQNVVTLNLSSNRVLHLNQISDALNSEYRVVLPRLLTLCLAKVKTSFVTSVRLDSYFFRSIGSGRKLKHLDFSELNIYRFDFNAYRPMCTTVESVDLRKSIIGNVENYLEAEACTALKTVDISESVIPALRAKYSFEHFYFYCESLTFYAYLENFFADKVNTEHELEMNGYLLDMSTCPLKFRKIYISGNKMKWINITVHLHETTKKTLSVLNMSYNGMEYISPLVLHPSENIEILDFSNNKLSVMQENYRADFEVLFRTQTKLLYLNLSFNSLSEIPKKTFIENRSLRVLDISFNRIKVLGFYVAQLVNIETIIARYNIIHSIEENARQGIQLLLITASNNITYGNIRKKTLHVYLKGNQFICTCDRLNMKLIDWLHSTAVIDDSERITCKLAGDVVNIRDTAPRETKTFCTMQIVKTAAMICAPLICTILLLSLVTVITIKKRRKKKRQILSVISQIEMGSFPLSYLAFLSYCSEDMDLVVNKIYPQLCKNLAEMTNSNKPLVCIGDQHFRPGFALRYEVMRCVDESSVFIAVISRKFCLKTWCNLEIGWAYDQNKPIIMLMVEHVEKKLMDSFLQKIFNRYTHATWISDNDDGHIEPDWKIFCTSIIQLAGSVHSRGCSEAETRF